MFCYIYYFLFFKKAKRLLGDVGPACFLVEIKQYFFAQELSSFTKLFISATSLGGVESSIEMKGDPLGVRISVGVEDKEELRADLENAFAECEIKFNEREEQLNLPVVQSKKDEKEKEKCIIS